MPDKRQTRWMRFRMHAAVVMLLVFGGLLLGRIWTLQVTQSDWLEGLAREQYLKDISLESMRGPIVDRNHTPIALSVMTDSIFASPVEVKNFKETARKLAGVLSLDASQLFRKLASGKHFVWIKRRITPQEANRVRELGLVGVHFTRESRRYYPARELAGSVVGFAGDGRGLEGVELMFEGQLRGATVLAQGIRDARGNILFAEGVGDQDVSKGGGIVLTIDLAIQEIVESELMQTVTKFRAKAATAIVLEPFSGEVLAMANVPPFNPNTFWKFAPGHFRNRAITDCFEPGSTFKVFTMATALQNQKIHNRTRIDCEDGRFEVAGHVIHDPTKKSKGWMTPTEILVTSSNVGIAKIGMSMGREQLLTGLRRFGFGKKVGIDLPGEMGCVLRNPRSDIGLATIPFGQGVSVTPLQLVTALGSVANGGVWMRPLVVREVRGPKGEIWKQYDPEPGGRVLEAGVARELTKMMIEVTQPGGTGALASIDGFNVAGKTGTAQKADPISKGYSKDKAVASFMGFVPAERPRIAVLVVVDEPATNSFGSVVAAPAFSKISEAILRYLKVFPVEQLDVVAAAAPSNDNERHLPMGSATAFVERAASSDWPKKEGLPDLRGASIREALSRLSPYGVEVEVQGSGRVTGQTTKLAKAGGLQVSKVSLTLERMD